tara:strand:- start:1112 stop:1924 length:813 start_codon:yes stop_codon:yes gene_type:complete
MAKKQETKKEEVEVPVVETPVVETKKPKKSEWEIKDRLYYLKGGKKPLSKMIKSTGIYWFDESKGFERELKYCENQQTPFVDEMKGQQRLSHIIFRSGSLYVPKEKTILQKLLSLYHPHRNQVFYEHKPAEIAEQQIDILELEADAIIAARNIDIDMAEAIMRVEVGSKVSEMSSKELKRDLLLFARRNPNLFLELLNDDNVTLRNIGIRAVEEGVLKLSRNQRDFLWGSNDRKIMTIPFDEHPYTALAHWFKTDEGMEVFKSIEKRLNN